MPPLQRYVIALTGGLQDSKSVPDPSDLVRLYNFSLFRGRFALRAPTTQIHQIGSNEDVILHMTTHLNAVWVLTWSSLNEDVDLYSFDFEEPGTGWPPETHKQQIYTGVTSRPNMFLTSFSGGTADAPEDRLYIADYDQNEVSKYWVESTSTLTTVSEDFDADNSVENAYFSLITPYQFHLWGTGFYSEYGFSGDALRPEMLRFSQPGVIPNVDPAGGTPSSKEWFTFNHRSVGRRGDKIKALSYAAGNFMVFQAGSTHAVFGYGQDSWATKQLSDHIGCVGPRAATSVDTGGLCYFWSHDGPFATDGTQLRNLGEDIRQHVIDHQADERVSVASSPDDGMVYFTLYEEGADVDASPDPEYYLAYDTSRQRWCDGSWLKGTGSPVAIPVSCMVTATPRDIAEAPGPSGDPTNLAVAAHTQGDDGAGSSVIRDWVTLTWTSAEFAKDAKTYIYRDTSPGFTPGAGNLQWIIPATRTRFTDNESAKLFRTTYYWKVRHFRNGTFSGNSNEVNETTWCEVPTYVAGESLETGIKWRIGVPAVPEAAGVLDVELQRASSFKAYQNNDWFSPTTLNDQAEDAEATYTDSSNITSGQNYYLRARVLDVDNSGTATPSSWVYGKFPVVAGVGVTGDLTLSSPTIAAVQKNFGRSVITASVAYSQATPFTDYIRVYVDDGDGYPVDDAPNQTVVCDRKLGVVRVRFTYNCPYLDTVSVRFKSFAMNEVLTDTETTSSVDPCSGAVY